MSETTTKGAEMEAGRDLDALIAERVMGYEWRDVRLRGETNTVPVLLHPSVGDIDGMYDRASLRHPRYAEYSTDIAAAWEVVEHMRAGEDGYDCELSSEDGVWSCWFLHWRRDSSRADAESAPLAICRAALASLDAT